ncbi:MAG: protein-methionine-sulfoxide reductase heme-binding subunit MsrQ [Bryobacteraceae bacterium]
MNKILSSKWAKVVVFLLAFAPAAVLAWAIVSVAWLGASVTDYLTANPLQYITHYTGDWTLRMLMVTLTVTPLRVLFNRPAITRFRRMVGLFTYFYASLHLLTWVWFDRNFEVSGMWEDIAMRLYITVGMAAFLAMTPLAITSTQGWVRRMGFQRWQKLHMLIYPAGILGVLHFLWLVKSDIREPLLYGGILAVLLGFRVVTKLRKAKKASSPAMTSR